MNSSESPVAGRYPVLLILIARNPLFTPLALYALSASVKEEPSLASVDVDVMETTLQDSDDVILSRIATTGARLVGFSVYVWNRRRVLILARKIHRLRPDVKIVLGGPEVSHEGLEILRNHPDIAFVVRDEGERTFSELVGRLIRGEGFEGIPGLTFRDGEALRENEPREPVKSLDELPSPYLTLRPDVRGREVALETQRGCPYDCSFCYYNKELGSVRNFPMDRIREELKWIFAQAPQRIYLMDPVFNLNAKRAKEICRFVLGESDGKIPFHTEIRAELVDDELADLMGRAGFNYVEVGLQSNDEGILETVGRRLDRRKFEHGVDRLKAHGVFFVVQLIFGLPGETKESFLEAVDYVASVDPPHVELFRLLMLPGTRLRRQAEELRLTYEPDAPYALLETPTMPYADILWLEAFARDFERLRKMRSLRFLRKETGFRTHRALVERWILWNSDQRFFLQERPVGEVESRIRRFIGDLAKEAGSDAGFYLAMAEPELAAPQLEETRAAAIGTATVGR